jgi:hypothetical protein
MHLPSSVLQVRISEPMQVAHVHGHSMSHMAVWVEGFNLASLTLFYTKETLSIIYKIWKAEESLEKDTTTDLV